MNYRGFVDCVNEFEIGGWAVNRNDQREKLLIDIVVNGELVGSCKACAFRKDLVEAGVSEDGYAGFYFNSRGCMKKGKNSVRILYSGTDVLLEPRRVGGSVVFYSVVLGKESIGDLVDLLVRALRGEDDRDQ